jgi:uncharacterized membrane protein YbaN (DUF454 family)
MPTERNGLGWVILRQGAGYASLAAGVAGCILPIIPGIPLLFVGLGLLAVDSPWAARLRDKLKEKAGAQWEKVRGKAVSKPEVEKVPK